MLHNQVYVSYGSNLGDIQANIQHALALLAADARIRIERQSAFYQTTPVGPVSQADFVNGALKLQTDYAATELLAVLQAIEQACLRQRTIHWGPRTLDLDIIFFNQEQSQTPVLTIPHPETFNRLFVLVPILEICEADFYQRATIEQQINVLQATATQAIKQLEEVDDGR